MIPFKRRTSAVIIFTILIILLVNIAWWLFYSKTEQSFDLQLSHRLSALARLGGSDLNPELITALREGYLSAYNLTLEIIDKINRSDSLSEVFIIDANYNYLASSDPEPDTLYYLAVLNKLYIDSLFSSQWTDMTDGEELLSIVTPSYQVGDVFLKSAFAPLHDTLGQTIAVLGIEADVNYSAALLSLRKNLYLSSFISILGGLIFGLFFYLIQQRINATENSLFLTQSQANLGRMVAVVSHEIKNPLMIIRASAERLGKDGAKEAQFIIEESDRLNSIVSGYLDFASGKRQLNKHKLDIIKLLSEIVEKYAPRLAQSNISLIIDKRKNKINISADEVALRQVLINLILNAAEASKSDESGKVELSLKQQSDSILISVADYGVGIDKKLIKSIFEPFYTTKTSGSGLGLFFSRRLMRDMGGDIILQSQPGGPTIFSIVLPTDDKG
jgi:two-component system, NtrC family, sensor histidine kinase HydH